jgi:hypothetical protein
MEAMIALFGLLGTIGVWAWLCFLFAVCMVAEAKNRSAFWALCAYVLTGPAAVFYYLAVPAIRPQPAPTLTQQEVIDAFVAATRGPARGAP